MNAVPNLEMTPNWRTDQMRLLDSPELLGSAARALNGALTGTGKPYDLSKVTDDLVRMIFDELTGLPRAYAETALAAFGALAGFSVQMGLRETLVKSGKAREEDVFTIVKAGGETFYCGALSDEGLFAGKPGNLSLYSFVAGAVREAGAKRAPDAEEIAAHVASTIGAANFGALRVRAENTPALPPVLLLQKFWNPVRNYLVLNVQAPSHWPFALGLAAQKAIVALKPLLDPGFSGRLVMEAAAAMAKVDPASIRGASLPLS